MTHEVAAEFLLAELPGCHGRFQCPGIPQSMGTSVDFDLLLVDLEHFVPRQKGLFHPRASALAAM